MYSESDLDSAVAAGVLAPDAAIALRGHVAATATSPAVDEEQFRLLTGFNDIFVSIAAVLLLVAVGWIGTGVAPSKYDQLPSPVGFTLVAAASWGLAEFFTRRRRMALPSIILLLAYVIGVFVTMFGIELGIFGSPYGFNSHNPSDAIMLAVAAAITAGAAWLHWHRFHVPITIAAIAIAAVGAAIAFIGLVLPAGSGAGLGLILIGGLALFAFAMWWDMSDRTRTTRRSDVAFWLHLAAAPMIAHPIFNGLGVLDGSMTGGTAIGVLVLYVLFAVIALAIDRRALLVSSLVYVLYAMSSLFQTFGAVGINFALTGLVIGSALLLLSAFWHPIRRVVVAGLPARLQQMLPVTDRQPARASS